MNAANYRSDIDGLRSLAVVPVVLGHAGVAGFEGGFIGVDIFFVISGYLITSILAREIAEERFSIVAFYERRARRILPALFFVIAICMLAGWFILLPLQYESMAKSAVAALAFASNVWFWHSASDYFSPGVAYEPLLHTWSLGVEEQFYIFFPLLLWALAAKGRTTWLPVIGAFAIASFALSLWGVHARPVATFYLPFSRIWELGLGALLVLWLNGKAIGSQRMGEVTGVIGLALIAAAVLLIEENTPFPGAAALAPCIGAALLIGSGYKRSTFASRLLGLRPLVWLGLISYSLYLWHWPILVAARLLSGEHVLSPLVIALCVVMSVLLAWVSWAVVEQPFRKRAGEVALSRGQIFAFSGLGTSALAAAAAAAVLTSGFAFRLPNDMRSAYEAASRRAPLDQKCMNKDAASGPCRLGEDGNDTIDVMVWGDSHAGAMLPGIEDWLITTGQTGAAFTHTACAPLLGITRADREASHGCNVNNAEVMDFLASRNDIRTVILAARWALNVEGLRPEGEMGGSAVLAREGDAAGGIDGNAALTAEGLEATLQALRGRGMQIILVAGLPEMRRNVPDAIVSARFRGNAIPEFVDQGSHQARNRRSRPMLDALAAQYDAQVLDPAELLCSQGECMAENDGQFIYRDDDHLSEFGAKWLMPRLLDSVAKPTEVATPTTEEPLRSL